MLNSQWEKILNKQREDSPANKIFEFSIPIYSA